MVEDSGKNVNPNPYSLLVPRLRTSGATLLISLFVFMVRIGRNLTFLVCSNITALHLKRTKQIFLLVFLHGLRATSSPARVGQRHIYIYIYMGQQDTTSSIATWRWRWIHSMKCWRTFTFWRCSLPKKILLNSEHVKGSCAHARRIQVAPHFYIHFYYSLHGVWIGTWNIYLYFHFKTVALCFVRMSFDRKKL